MRRHENIENTQTCNWGGNEVGNKEGNKRRNKRGGGKDISMEKGENKGGRL